MSPARLVLFGDSHVRSYTGSRHITASIFLRQGRRQNFTSLRSALTSFLYVITLWNGFFDGTDYEYAVVLGEPDCRKAVYNTFAVETDPAYLTDSVRATPLALSEACKQSLRSSIGRIRIFIDALSFFGCKPYTLIGAGSPNIEMKEAVLYFNRCLRRLCVTRNILFFDPSIHYYTGSNDFRRQLIGSAYNDKAKIDATHFSRSAGRLFDGVLDGVLPPFDPRRGPFFVVPQHKWWYPCRLVYDDLFACYRCEGLIGRKILGLKNHLFCRDNNE